MKPIALLDLDGTVADFNGEMEKYLAALRGPNEKPTPKANTEAERLALSQQYAHIKARRDLIKGMKGFWENLPVLKSGMEILDELRFLDYHVQVLTKASLDHSDAWSEKVRWVNKNLGHMPVHICRDKALVYGRVLVDDWPDYITPWLEFRPRGRVVMPAHDYNAEAYDLLGESRVLRHVGNRADLRDFLREAKRES